MEARRLTPGGFFHFATRVAELCHPETEFNGIGAVANLHRCRWAAPEKTDDSMQEAAAITAIGGAAIALIAAYSLWTLRGRK
jgi:hypothetical protein